jgi:hypothetical protein
MQVPSMDWGQFFLQRADTLNHAVEDACPPAFSFRVLETVNKLAADIFNFHSLFPVSSFLFGGSKN